MKITAFHSTCFAWAALLFVADVLPAAAQRGGPGRDSTEVAAFSIIETRNIFDASRLPRIIRTNRTEIVRPPPPPPAPQIDYITCVGTMNYEKGPYAFFEGSRAAYEQVLRVSNRIAGLTLTGIEPECVRLTTGSNELCVPVGGQLTQERSGPWRVVTNQQVASVSARSSSFGSFGGLSTRDTSTRSGGGLFGRNRGGGGGGLFGRSSRNPETGAAGAGSAATPASGDSPPSAGSPAPDALQSAIQRALEERAAAEAMRGASPPPPDAPGGFEPGE
jgi:hypothetical protein